MAFKKAKFNHVQVENTGTKALEKLKKINPEIIFLDMVMPDMNGKDVFKAIQKENKNIPVIFMSGKININKLEIQKIGAYDFVKKPFSIITIFDIINQIKQNKKNIENKSSFSILQ
jgi:DNA-binding NtrC family response regulator